MYVVYVLYELCVCVRIKCIIILYMAHQWLMIQSVLLLFFFFCLIINIIGPCLVKYITLVQTRSILMAAWKYYLMLNFQSYPWPKTLAWPNQTNLACCQMSAISRKIMRERERKKKRFKRLSNTCLIQFES